MVASFSIFKTESVSIVGGRDESGLSRAGGYSMPVTSRRQFRKIWSLVERGELTREKAKEMTAGVDYDKLPEKAKKKKKGP